MTRSAAASPLMHVKISLSAGLLGLLLVSTIPSYAQTDGRNDRPKAVKAWEKKIVAQLASKGVFPPTVRDGGTVEVKFVIDRQGKLISRVVAKSSGSELLDAAALTTVEQAEPFPEAPAQATDDMLTFIWPFVFARKPSSWDEQEAKVKAKVNGVCRGC